MTHAYLYIEESGTSITAGTRFFKCYIGNGRVGRSDLSLIQRHAQEHGHFFQKWTSEVDSFINKINESLNGAVPAVLIGCDSVSLRLHLLKGKPLETPSQYISNRRRVLTSIHSDFYFFSN